MIIRRIKKVIAEAALFLFFMTAAPAVYAMAEIDTRDLRRAAVVQMVTIRQRRRALDRRHGYTNIIQYQFHFVS